MPKPTTVKVEEWRRNEAMWESGKVVGRRLTVIYRDGSEAVLEERRI